MTFESARAAIAPILAIQIRSEEDVVLVRQRARQLAGLMGFSNQDQVRAATAASEVGRNAYRRGGGRMEFGLALVPHPQVLWMTVLDTGASTAQSSDEAFIGPRRLMDSFEVESKPGQGTTVRFSKVLPAEAPRLNGLALAGMANRLAQTQLPRLEESQIQTRDLMETLESLRIRELELEKRNAEMRRINAELEETNRGVVALYAELDEKAIALRSADELKTRFLRHVSHEFRTPLNSILALTHLLLRRTDGELSGEQERQVGYIRKAVQDLTEMVNDLLDLAKVEAGKTELHVNQIHLGQFFGMLRGVMRPLVVSDAVTLIFDDPPDDLVLISDESKVTQIMRNLISNALKFTERGEVRVSFESEADWLSLSVSDTGIGIALEDQERIFHEFTQVKHDMQARVKGTGLGLPLSRKLAGLLGGHLIVTSQPGEGARFTLKLPLIQDRPEAPDLIDDVRPVLIIDDEETARYIVRQRLKRTRHPVIEASGGAEGAERARFDRPVLIFLDIMMPGRGGFEVLEELKSDPATRDIPVLIHTSRHLTGVDLEKLGGRQAGILPKGEFWPPETLEYISDLLGESDLFEGEGFRPPRGI